MNLLHLVDYDAVAVVGHVNYVLHRIQPRKTKLGAGAGSWNDFAFFQKLATQTAVDFLDYHRVLGSTATAPIVAIR